MTQTPHELPTDLDSCHQLIRELLDSLSKQTYLNEKLQHQLQQLLRHRFGAKAERIDPAQLLLFAREILEAGQAEAEIASPPSADTPEGTTDTPKGPKKKGHGRKPLPASLPRKPVLHEVPHEELVCPDCGSQRQRFGEEIREQLEYVPAHFIVLEHIRPKYACKDCAANVIIAAPLPAPIDKGLPGPGLLAYVTVSKYVDHLPLYRQERIFLRNGVELARSTMCDWMAWCADLLQPIYRAMNRLVLESRVIQTDDTPVPVQDARLNRTRQGRLWVYLGDRHHPYAFYDYTPDRSGAGPEKILKGYQGYLQADAYSGYDQLYASGKIIEIGCMAHARRKFYEAKESDKLRAHVAMAYIRRLYDVEADAKELEDDERFALRQARAGPILEEFRGWLEAQVGQFLPKSPIGEAIGYALRNWKALKRYLDAGFLSIDNNAAERALRTIALGRKNWLFAGSDAGGRTAAVLITLTSTCTLLKIDPFAYLQDVLGRIATHPKDRIEELLPDRWQASRQAAAEPISR